MQNNGRPNTDTPTTEKHDGAAKPQPQHDDKSVPIQTTTNNNNNHLELILQELRNVSSDVSSLKRKHDSLEKKVAKSLTVKKPSPTSSVTTDVDKRPSSQSMVQQPPPKRPKHSDNHQRSTRINTQSQTSHSRKQPSHRLHANDQQRDMQTDTQTSHQTHQHDQHNNTQHVQFQQAVAQATIQPNTNYQPANSTTAVTATPTGMSVNNTSSVTSSQGSNNPWDSFINPFMPPEIKATQLKKIEDGEFIDFADLLPENQATSIDASHDDDRPGIGVEKSSGYLKQKDSKSRKVKVNTFQRWSTAWVAFSQAHLHYHPEDYYELFSYHASFVEFVGDYKFAACFAYDRDFRLNIANQRNVVNRKHFWSTPNEKLRTRHLSNNGLTKCSYCKGSGHFESGCTHKQKDESETLPAQLAAALTMTKSQLMQQQQPSRGASSHPHQQTWSNNNSNNNNNNNNNYNNNNNFRPPRNSQPTGGRIPPAQKPCWYFQAGRNCRKPPCQFLHTCEKCGSPQHGGNVCDRHTSTNFIPLSGPQG